MSIEIDKPYTKEPKPFNLKEFSENKGMFVCRPPYQRRDVWSTSQKEALIESFFRRHYVPGIVLREVRTPDSLMKYEVVDGQQRILAIQAFFDNEIRLSKELSDLTPETGKKYRDLPKPVQNYIDHRTLDSVVLGGLTNPENKKNQQIVAKVFWNLQQGKKLDPMEVEHSKLYSAARNFITRYADNMSFDYKIYESLDANPYRHKFFQIINKNNNR